MPRPRKGARLYLRRPKDGPPQWVILDGTRERRTGALEQDLEGAEAALQEYIAGKPRAVRTRGSDQVPIAEVLEGYLLAKVEKVGAPHIIEQAVRKLAEHYTNEPCSALTPQAVEAFVDWRCSQPSHKRGLKVKRSTAARELTVLRAAVRWAWSNKILSELLPIAVPGRGPARRRYLTRSEAALLLAAALGWQRLRSGRWIRHHTKICRHLARFILVGLYTGTRHHAILSLQWRANTTGGWFELADGTLHRRAEEEDESDKRQTSIPIPPRIMPHVRRWQRRSATHVVEWHGLPIGTQIKKAWLTARMLAGLEEGVVPHTLRHTCATWLLQEGVSTWDVAGVLGCTEQVVRDTYGHHARDHLRSAVDVFSRRPARARAASGGTNVVRFLVPPKNPQD